VFPVEAHRRAFELLALDLQSGTDHGLPALGLGDDVPAQRVSTGMVVW
jgi:hypothetical protein